MLRVRNNAGRKQKFIGVEKTAARAVRLLLWCHCPGEAQTPPEMENRCDLARLQPV